MLVQAQTSADGQGVLSDVDRLMGAASVRRVRLPVVSSRLLAEHGWLPWPPLRRLSPPAPLGRLVTAVGALLGFYLAGYTGVLLAVTNRPIWADTNAARTDLLILGGVTSARS